MPRTVVKTLPGVAVGAEGVTVISELGDVAVAGASFVGVTGGVVLVACAVAVTAPAAVGMPAVGEGSFGPVQALSTVKARVAMTTGKFILRMILLGF